MQDIFEFDYEFKDEKRKSESVIVKIKTPDDMNDYCIDTNDVFYQALEKIEQDIENGLKSGNLTIDCEAVLYSVEWNLKTVF